MTDVKISTEDLWNNWIKRRDKHSANLLVEHYLYLVDYHVQRIAVHLPKSVLKDDIRSLGIYGLYDALQKFDPSRDLKFDTYASFRIRGAIIDGLRKEDWLPRSTREKAKKIEQATQVLEQELYRQPTVKEIANHLSMNVNEVETISKDSLFANLLSIEEKSSDSDDLKEGIGYNLPDKKQLTPEDNLLQQEKYQDLSCSIRELNKNEQLVISLFYQDELTFTEIGHVLSLTTSRISQIHKQAIFKLKQALS
ncbi:FliA/WhiG family RNA polymerase sigma factor [Natronobacillus azotifigens]|uniref:FliA/WhiG family RNA polymerase sigma factor n=1 Tax=Natronobacillus azotifigens TaxID=472978 RepID=A0A9J6RB82_9BACI|nr:FliA/WhiG family RNA polymerase sigma factor [Natronobacillus azotifigens]